MGCSNTKSTKDLPVIAKNEQNNKSLPINPHDEDDVAEVIQEGRAKDSQGLSELDKAVSMKKDESKATLNESKPNFGESKGTLHESNSVNKSLISERKAEPEVEESARVNYSVSMSKNEKPSFEKVEHKFEFDLDVEEKAEKKQDEHKEIDDVLVELNNI